MVGVGDSQGVPVFLWQSPLQESRKNSVQVVNVRQY